VGNAQRNLLSEMRQIGGDQNLDPLQKATMLSGMFPVAALADMDANTVSDMLGATFDSAFRKDVQGQVEHISKLWQAYEPNDPRFHNVEIVNIGNGKKWTMAQAMSFLGLVDQSGKLVPFVSQIEVGQRTQRDQRGVETVTYGPEAASLGQSDTRHPAPPSSVTNVNFGTEVAKVQNADGSTEYVRVTPKKQEGPVVAPGLANDPVSPRLLAIRRRAVRKFLEAHGQPTNDEAAIAQIAADSKRYAKVKAWAATQGSTEE
jgi:hypothetical protein